MGYWRPHEQVSRPYVLESHSGEKTDHGEAIDPPANRVSVVMQKPSRLAGKLGLDRRHTKILQCLLTDTQAMHAYGG